MKLPFKGDFKISQHFGENLNTYYKADGLIGHQGIDFAMPTGTPVYSTVNGKVISVSRDIQKGEGVAILSTDTFDYHGVQCVLDTIYWHMKDKSIWVNVGDTVIEGQEIGLSNNTGQSTGAHLHFSIIPLYNDGSRRSIESYENGYHACVDPMMYLEFPKHIFSTVLKFDMKGQEVKELQKVLNTTIDGIFGVKTLQAVQNFQKAHGLVADGIVGVKTNTILNTL